MRIERPLIKPKQTPQPVQGQPIDLAFLINAHQYLMTILPERRSEAVRKAIDHLEDQISKVILTINLRIGPPL